VGVPMSAVAFRRMVTRLGPAAKRPFGIHPRILRAFNWVQAGQSGCGYSVVATISATRISSIRFDIANFLPSGSAISGRTKERLADTRWASFTNVTASSATFAERSSPAAAHCPTRRRGRYDRRRRRRCWGGAMCSDQLFCEDAPGVFILNDREPAGRAAGGATPP
jgi:hypothetical protein